MYHNIQSNITIAIRHPRVINICDDKSKWILSLTWTLDCELYVPLILPNKFKLK